MGAGGVIVGNAVTAASGNLAPSAQMRAQLQANPTINADGRMQLPTETAHVRTVISRYGGVIKQAAAVAIPQQTVGGFRSGVAMKQTVNDPGHGKGSPNLNSHRERAGGWMVGYSGHRPGARDITHTMAGGGVPLFHRPEGSRQQLGQGIALDHRPTTAFQEIAPTLKGGVIDVPVVGGVGIAPTLLHLPLP
uniref:Uncharacterized protein n=1 Tax=Haptolina brevifila TaxID=156173 RepID=A0A7S2N7L8_9EUKA